jgi:hypothetical protein
MRIPPAALGLGLAAVLWGGAVAVSPRAEADRAHGQELLYYPNGRFVKQAVLGYDQAASSVAWLRTVQYYGEHKRGDREFDYMYHLCDVVTDLDPHFEEPYVFGSFVLHTEGKRPAEGLELLAKGRRRNPDSWQILFESGFDSYIFWNRYAEAAKYLEAAATVPGSPEYTARFAAYVAKKAGRLETSLLLWKELAQRTGNPKMRDWALKRAEEIQARIDARDAGPAGGGREGTGTSGLGPNRENEHATPTGGDR